MAKPDNPYPYPIHTNRELEFMLAGIKPLAVFSAVYLAEANEKIIPEQAFSPYVKQGVFVKHEEIIEGTIRLVLYATAAEKWRISAYLQLCNEAENAGWNEDFERRQGKLLGYEDWQNDFHIENRFKKDLPHFDE